ncbi:hypothetical protein PsAD2_04194 [Pseudovibrio axinellae]|uniref:Uncharacterized protein n=1 Tax=Pseudovibrio axinellae TaxID=989403 RepID=A0A165TVJ9_9HYPH|nr:hypothetical protein [Pseudovibrio axinellae]KZL06681.1 hypothetical protein PsAD2_04194 [Pseudovibrio axinellae]SER60644.1 hypothetical protein SAMN05421798_1146 [Pseudovibrio axinellae]
MKPVRTDLPMTQFELSSGPFAPLAMPEQDLCGGESWLTVLRRRLQFGRTSPALPAKRARLQRVISLFSER